MKNKKQKTNEQILKQLENNLLFYTMLAEQAKLNAQLTRKLIFKTFNEEMKKR